VGTVTGTGGPYALTAVSYKSINDAAELAYSRQTKKTSGVGAGNTLKLIWEHAIEFLQYLKDPYKLPQNAADNDAVVLCLQELSHWFEDQAGTNFPGNPDARVLAVMANANHQTCIVYLDSILQGLYAYRHHKFDSGARPEYEQNKSETDYFVGYVDALGNVPN
jgi:hypothetical protein